MSSIVKSLVQLIAALPQSDETQAALAFLKQPGLTQIAPSGDQLSYHSANHWLRIYRIRHESCHIRLSLIADCPGEAAAIGAAHHDRV